jgi:transcriptional regulator with XRE-family HTH domain
MKYRRRLSRKLKQIKGRQSQAVFARRIGIKQSSLNRILQSKQPLNLDMLEVICTHLDLDISELMKADANEPLIENPGTAIFSSDA